MPDCDPAAARIAVLVSGRGRNLQALIQAQQDKRIHGSIVGVISDRADAFALERAQQSGIFSRVVARNTFSDTRTFDAALIEALEALRPDIVVLAGFMRILGEEFVSRFEDKLINIHPSLLPRYRGLNTHQRALDSGDKHHGATVHLVNHDLDGGACIIQGSVSVVPQDTALTLAERVMNDVEIRILPQVVAWMAGNRLRLYGGSAFFDGHALDRPLSLSDLDPEFS